MISLLSVMLALRVGPGPVPPGPTFSVRAEARSSAYESELSPAALLEAGRDLAAAPQAPEWPDRPSARGAAPIFRAQRPEDWVSIAASQLNLHDKGLTQAALRATVWVLTAPVRVDVSPTRVYVALRIRAF
jgi:hypothetical protein